MTRINFVPIKQENIPKVELEYNNRTEQSYIKNGLTVPDNLDVQEKNVRSLVEPDTPIERTVTRCVRLKAPDYSSKKKELKEYLVYYENWYSRDWLGRSIAPVSDHVKGVYFEQEVEPVINNQGKVVGHERKGQHAVYYIPFSKEAVDQIINNSVGSYRENIIYVVKNGPEMRNDKYNYEQFTNLSFVECCDLMITKKGGPAMAAMEQQHQKILEQTQNKLNKQK